MHIIAAKAVCFGEALKPEFKEYQKQVIKNASVLADELLKQGFKLVSGGHRQSSDVGRCQELQYYRQEA